MKKTKRTILLSILLLWSFYSCYSQATLTLGSVSGVQTAAITVPVNATGITDMAGFQFTIQYDNTRLTYVSCTDWKGSMNTGGVQIVSLPSSGKLTFVYDDVPVNIISGKFFDINFTIKSGSSGTSQVSWSDDPTQRELYNSVPEVIGCSYTSGVVTILEGLPQVYNVTLFVKSNGNAVSGASVMLSGYGTQVTDISGASTFSNVVASVITYTVTKTGYYDKSGTITIVNTNVTENVSLNLVPPVTYQVAFLVRSGSLPVSDALVSLTGYGSKNSDSGGSAVFTNVAPSENLPYTIEKTGYSTKTGTVSVFVSDITENAALTYLTGAALSFGLVAAEPGKLVSVPIMALNLVDVTGFQFTIVYDKSRLTYVNCSDWSGGANGNGVQINHLSGEGKLTFIYNDVAVNISSGRFFDLNFDVNNNISGDAAFYWSDIPTVRELSNSKPEVVSCAYTDGKISIITASLPEVTTLKTCPVTSTTAAGGGIVISDGGSIINSRGICWSTNPDPTILDSKSINGNGTGVFASTINDLLQGTIYHVRAYATNSAGTAYGNDLTFIILPPPGSVIASDGLYWDKVTIEWGSVSGADSYVIYRDNSFLGNVIATNFVDENPLSTNANYKIYTNNSCGMSSVPGIDVGFVKIPVLYASSEILSLDWSSGTTALEITANMIWSVYNQSSWLVPSKQNESSLLISYAANTSLIDRKDTVEIYSLDPAVTYKIAILQKATTTGIEEKDNNAISIYPNPSSRELNIKMQSIFNGTIFITDILGRQMGSYKMSGELLRINIESFPPGMYLFSVQGEKISKTFRIIKKE
jgi:hypothetical protein